MAEAPAAIDVLTQPFPPEDPAELPGILKVLTDTYIDAPVMKGDNPDKPPMTVRAALAFEEMLCKPADEERRQDPLLRIHWMAGKLASAGSLRPEHMHLLPQE